MGRDRSFRPTLLAEKGTTCTGSWLCRMRGPRHPSEVEADHVVRYDDGGDDDPLTNGQVLCKMHHQRKTAREARPPVKAWKVVGALGVMGTMLGLVLSMGWMAVALAMERIEPALHQLVTAWTYGLGAWAVLMLAVLIVPAWLRAAGTDDEETSWAVEDAPDQSARLHESLTRFFAREDTYDVVQLEPGVLQLSYGGTQLDDSEDTMVKMAERASAKLGGRWAIEPDTTHDSLTFRLRPGLPDVVEHPGFPLGAARPWYSIPVGIDEHGKEWSFDMRTTPHLLLVGSTGAGKTSMIRAILAALIDSAGRGEVEIVCADPKRIELMRYRLSPHVKAVHTVQATIYDAVLDHRDESDARYAYGEDHPDEAGEATFPPDMLPRILICEELRQMFGMLDREARARKEAVSTTKPCEARVALQEVAQMGRSGGCHLILITQRPDAKWLGGDIRELTQGRALVGANPDGIVSRMMFGSGMYGRDVPSNAKGRATIQVGEVKPVEVQTYWMP